MPIQSGAAKIASSKASTHQKIFLYLVKGNFFLHSDVNYAIEIYSISLEYCKIQGDFDCAWKWDLWICFEAHTFNFSAQVIKWRLICIKTFDIIHCHKLFGHENTP